MARLKVELHETPNPNAGKFVVNRKVLPAGTSRSYHDPAEAHGDPVAGRLMALPGVRSLFMVDDFITVTKAPAVPWAELESRVRAIVEEHLPEPDPGS